jgi:NTE family protein
MRLPFRAVGILALVLAVSPLRAQQSCDVHPLALVLSGGGAKGLAHIGTLEVLDSLGIRPDLVVGTSMGSIVGALYAAGYTGRQIDTLARSLKLADLFRRDQPRAPRVIGDEQPVLLWEQGTGRFEVGHYSVQEPMLVARLNVAMLHGNLVARGDFDSLPIPFRAVATDLANRQQVVIKSGDLAQAVRASMSIPVVFHPETIDRRVLGDGGLVANVPVGVARFEGAQRLIVSDVSWRSGDSLNFGSPFVVMDQLIGFLFTQPGDSEQANDRWIVPDTREFSALDFADEKIGTIIERGHRAAAAALADGWCGNPPGEQRPPLPHLQLQHLSVNQGTAVDVKVVRDRLRIAPGDRLDVPDLRKRLAALADLEDYEEVWLNPSGRPDSLAFNVNVRRAAPRLAAVGIGYDTDVGGRAWVGLLDRGATLSGIEASAFVNLSELRQYATLALRPQAAGGRRLRPMLEGMGGGESVRLFDPAGTQVGSDRVGEARGFLGLEHDVGRSGSVALGAIAYGWGTGIPEESGAGAELRVSSGRRYLPTGFVGQYDWGTNYSRLDVSGRAAIPLAGFTLTPEVLYGIGTDLPEQLTFMLGDYEGFPGLHIGERRGDHQTLLRLTAVHRLIGPFDLRLQGSTGQVSFGGSAFPTGNWLYGGRVGLGLDTPIGGVRVEYGRNNEARDQFFFRLGERY